MTTNDDQKPKDTTEADSSAGVSCAAAAGYAVALEALAQMSRDEGMLSMQAGLADDPLARLNHKQNEVALAYAHLRLKRHTKVLCESHED